MKKLSLALASSALAATVLAVPAHSAINGDLIAVNNKSPYAVWVTTYKASNSRGTIVKARCYPAGAHDVQQSTSKGGWVLFEFKASATSCAEHGNIKVVERNVNSHVTINPNNLVAD